MSLQSDRTHGTNKFAFIISSKMKPSKMQVIVLICFIFTSPSVSRTVKNVRKGTQQRQTSSAIKIEAKQFGDCDESIKQGRNDTQEAEEMANSTCEPSKCDFYKKNYDIQKILRELGGPPGKVDIKWENVEDAPKKNENGAVIWYPDRKYWLYDYRKSDRKTYIRLEYAFRRNSGTPEEFIAVRGELYWTPPQLCGDMRYATYFVDDTGFEANVSRECRLVNGEKLVCSELPDCEECLSGGGNINLLLQSLLG